VLDLYDAGPLIFLDLHKKICIRNNKMFFFIYKHNIYKQTEPVFW